MECASVGGTRRGTLRATRHRGHREQPHGIRRRSSTPLLSQCRAEDVDDRWRDGTTRSSPSPRKVFNKNRGYKPRQDTHWRAGGIIGTTMCDTAWHEPLSGGVRGGLELEIVIWWARRGETYCVLVAT